MNPRKPTQEEKQELLESVIAEKYLKTPTEEERQDDAGMIENAAISVFDHYITDGPGYAGKIMVVVWSGDPSFTETYIWDREYENGKVNIPVRDTRTPDEGNYTTKLHKIEIEVSNKTDTRLFTHEELQAIEEAFHDALKDDPDDKLYQSIHRKADILLYGEKAA